MTLFDYAPEAVTPAGVTARNLWHADGKPYSKPFFTYTGKCLLSYRGFTVYKNCGGYDYLFAGAVITQRAGMASQDRGREVIEDLINGITPLNPVVAAHIRANGCPNARSWDDAR